MITVPARPDAFAFDPARTALIVIDMQRDFLEPGGFGAMLGNDVTQLGDVAAQCASTKSRSASLNAGTCANRRNAMRAMPKLVTPRTPPMDSCAP